MPIAYYSHPQCSLHDNGHEHPEQPARISTIADCLAEAHLEFVLRHLTPPQATREQLCRAHDPAYVDMITKVRPITGTVHLDGDTCMNPHTLDAALYAAGAAVDAVDRVMKGDFRRAFCNTRPPGHHAEYRHAMGFCIFNNVAVAAAHAIAQYGLKRVAIVDFDVHHGNGTEDIFKDNKQVMYCSTFQHPLYPFSGVDTSSDNIINVPLPPGTDGAAYATAMEERLLPKLNAFAPELLFISAGFDAHLEDPLANLMLTDADYSWITQQLVEVANKHCDGRIISTLEGGYSLPALGRAATAHINALLG